MRRDLVVQANPELVWMRQLSALRKQHRALRVGDFRLIEADRLLAFERHTSRALDTVWVLSNPTQQAVSGRVLVANAALMDDTPMAGLGFGRPSTQSILHIGKIHFTHGGQGHTVAGLPCCRGQQSRFDN